MKLSDLLRNTIRGIGNLRRSLRRRGLDTIVLTIHGTYPERTIPKDPLPFPLHLLPIFPSPDPSLADMRAAMEVVGADQRIQNVVLYFDSLQAGMPTLHSLRRILLDLRGQGKRLIAWLPSAGNQDYYLASACDEIMLPAAGRLQAWGLRAEAVFIRDTLEMIGIEADFESIAEYKTSPDVFRRSTMSEPHRQMLNDILDDVYEDFVSAIAEGRGFAPERVRELIDAMPFTAQAAVEAGLIDAVVYQDELASHLSPEEDSAPMMVTWQEATRWLRRPIKWTTHQQIGIVSLEGVIVPGRSRRVPIPLPVPIPFETQAGADTIAQSLRSAEANDSIVAVIFYVETPGGSSLASDLIWREVRRLREKKPVVVLMGKQATSGGYYVSTPANHIVDFPSTLTGSIGIWGGKISTAALYDKLGVGREAVQRGAMAGLYSEMSPFNSEERARIRQEMETGYALFKCRVAEGRGMTEEQVEEVARGRVWTGRQAYELDLVDELGDFETALRAAKELADLEPDQEYTLVDITPPRHTLLPPPFPSPQERPGNKEIRATLSALGHLARERVWALSPWMIHIRG